MRVPARPPRRLGRGQRVRQVAPAVLVMLGQLDPAARVPGVRQALVNYQKTFAKRPGGAVIEGRDIGTVVCPDADVKLFVEASSKVRAERRHRELLENGHDIGYEEILAQIEARDEADRSRAISPMKPAQDALLLDTSDLGIEAAFKAAVDLIDNATR